jgi:hypothetical protein
MPLPDQEGERDPVTAEIRAKQRINVCGEESLVFVELLEMGIILFELKSVEVFGFVAELLTDLVQKLPEGGRGFFRTHDGKEGVIPERLVAFESYLRDFQILPMDLGPEKAGTGNDENDTVEDPFVHPDIKKKPSHETLGSILALSVIKEGDLTGVRLRY